jgi:hypothetical protein
MVLTTAIANYYGARMRRRRRHWVHPHIAEVVSISRFSLKPLALPRHYYVRNIHANNRTSILDAK